MVDSIRLENREHPQHKLRLRRVAARKHEHGALNNADQFECAPTSPFEVGTRVRATQTDYDQTQKHTPLEKLRSSQTVLGLIYATPTHVVPCDELLCFRVLRGDRGDLLLRNFRKLLH